MAHRWITRMAQLWKSCGWSWQLSLVMMKQFDKGHCFRMDKVQLDHGALPLSQLAGWKAAAGGDWLLSSTGEVQPNREVGCSGRCIPFSGKCSWSA